MNEEIEITPLPEYVQSLDRWFGLWLPELETWLTDDSGIIFATSSLKVAEAQRKLMEGTDEGVVDPKTGELLPDEFRLVIKEIK